MHVFVDGTPGPPVGKSLIHLLPGPKTLQPRYYTRSLNSSKQSAIAFFSFGAFGPCATASRIQDLVGRTKSKDRGTAWPVKQVAVG